MKTIYLDNAATTPCRPEVVEAMLPYFTEKFGNPSAIYNLGQVAQDAIQQARKDIAGVINAASPNEVFFTSGGSEADNWALKGVMDAYKDKKGKHLITTKIEHHAILHTAQFLEQQGFEVTYLDVDKYGLVSPEAFEAASARNSSASETHPYSLVSRNATSTSSTRARFSSSSTALTGRDTVPGRRRRNST